MSAIDKKPQIDFIAYTRFVKRQCEQFKLNDITLNQFVTMISIKVFQDLQNFQASVAWVNIFQFC